MTGVLTEAGIKRYTLLQQVVKIIVPLISQFYGILIYIYKEKGGKHNIPHFHAQYAEYEGVYDFDGNLIDGGLPRKQSKLVEAWTLIHSDELNAAWKAWNESGEVIKIAGLR